MTYVTMNNFQVAAAQSEAFEQRWRQRRSHLQDVPGFKSFCLLRGAESDDAVHYASQAVWASREAFEAWTKSDNFEEAHSGDPLPEGMVLGHPQLHRFEVVLES